MYFYFWIVHCGPMIGVSTFGRVTVLLLCAWQGVCWAGSCLRLVPAFCVFLGRETGYFCCWQIVWCHCCLFVYFVCIISSHVKFQVGPCVNKWRNLGVLCLLFPHIPVIILKIMLVVLVCIARCYTCCTFLCFTGNIVPDSTRLSSGSPYGDVNQITQTSLGALRRYGPTLRLVVDHYKMTSSVVCHGGFWQWRRRDALSPCWRAPQDNVIRGVSRRILTVWRRRDALSPCWRAPQDNVIRGVSRRILTVWRRRDALSPCWRAPQDNVIQLQYTGITGKDRFGTMMANCYPVATLGTRRVHKRYWNGTINGTINICK